MRRGNIVGPMILISIGALLLVNNFVVDIPIERVFSDFWPVILILIGVANIAGAVAGSPVRRWGHVTGGVILITTKRR